MKLSYSFPLSGILDLVDRFVFEDEDDSESRCDPQLEDSRDNDYDWATFSPKPV